jgi:hypothetical protein
VATAQKSRIGCYGFRVTGLEAAADLMVAAPPAWPDLAVARAEPNGEPPDRDVVGSDAARLPLAGGGWIEVEPGRVAFRMDRPRPDGDILHPYLAPAAALAARWAGRESFHAGALLAGGGAWGVLGGKEDGKSTLLARLALDGCGVVSDDLLVVEEGAAMAGPRCIDLRGSAAERLGAGDPMGLVGVRERWRLRLGGVPASAPLLGWVLLEWAPAVAVTPVRGSERLLALPAHRSVQLSPRDPETLLALSSLPVWRLSRPRRWDELGETVQRLLGALAG